MWFYYPNVYSDVPFGRYSFRRISPAHDPNEDDSRAEHCVSYWNCIRKQNTREYVNRTAWSFSASGLDSVICVRQEARSQVGRLPGTMAV